jgi:hypothetical protein
MARNGSGTMLPVNNSWNPPVNGVLATGADFKSLYDDLIEAITQSVSRDGQSPMTGDLQMGGFKLTGMGLGTGTGQTIAWEQLFAQGTEADIASAETTDIGLQNTNFLQVTGTTTITSFGTNYRGPRFLRFAGAVTLTNSSTLIVPGATDYTTVAGDVLVAIPKATSGTADGWYVVPVVTTTGAQTLTNKTFKSYTETVYELVGTEIASTNGPIQYKTLTANTTFTETLTDGQSVVLMINPSTFAVTWPSITWIGKLASTPPSLVASVYNCITLFQINGIVYGKFEGRV